MAVTMMISKIVRLRQVVQRWKTRNLTRHDTEERNQIRSGSMAIYIGPERIRFLIRTRFLNYPVFAGLLEMAEEEYGFSSTGGIALPCKPGVFEGIVRLLESDEEKFCKVELDEFMKIVEDVVRFRQLDYLLCREYSSCGFNVNVMQKARV